MDVVPSRKHRILDDFLTDLLTKLKPAQTYQIDVSISGGYHDGTTAWLNCTRTLEVYHTKDQIKTKLGEFSQEGISYDNDGERSEDAAEYARFILTTSLPKALEKTQEPYKVTSTPHSNKFKITYSKDTSQSEFKRMAQDYFPDLCAEEALRALRGEPL